MALVFERATIVKNRRDCLRLFRAGDAANRLSVDADCLFQLARDPVKDQDLIVRGDNCVPIGPLCKGRCLHTLRQVDRFGQGRGNIVEADDNQRNDE